eukprot:TRINITY_DN5581_c0_g3_i1.p1 TRINITY_DN5581_c0_g3~~TRINITY_DN5581_c0_g3_i1.p1  ORF type:complete len:198 (-),score=29.43 TRINITY_DN5581_c0_g3_i1:36-629(-)
MLSTHSLYTSIWQGVRFSPWVMQRATQISQRLGLLNEDGTRREKFLAVHWRKGDWFLGPHPRKLEQAELAQPDRFAEVIKKHVEEQGLRTVFLMSNAGPESQAARELKAHLWPLARVVQSPVLRGDRNNLRQLCVEMAIATAADFFVAFGDGIVEGHVSMPSLLVIQTRLHAETWPLESNAFSFAPLQVFGPHSLGM